MQLVEEAAARNRARTVALRAAESKPGELPSPARVGHTSFTRAWRPSPADGDELLLVMDYVLGETLSQLIQRVKKRGELVPLPIACAIVHGILLGLHAAHEAKDGDGKSLMLVHRNVSPQNVMVGADGVARVLDFGIAKAEGRIQTTTQDGRVKGKLGYVAPEQIESSRDVDRRADVFSAGVVLWETLALRRLFAGETASETFARIVTGRLVPITSVRADVTPALDAALAKALERHPEKRFDSAADFAEALERACPLASSREVASWLEKVAGDDLRQRSEAVAKLEHGEANVEPTSATPAVVESLTPSEAMPKTIAEPTAESPRRIEAPPPQPKRRAVMLVVGAAAVGALLIGGALVSRSRSRSGVEPASLTASSPTATPSAPVEPTPVAVPEPTGSVTDVVELGDDDAAAAPSAAAKARAPGKTRTRPPRVTKPDCRSPFVIDSRGIRVPRPECF